MSRTPELSEYPDAPGFKTSGPSEEAAHAIAGFAPTLRDRVLAAIGEAPQGLTADVVACRLNKSVLSVRPRVSELHRLGEIRQSGARRKNVSGMTASIWVIAPPLQAEGGK